MSGAPFRRPSRRLLLAGSAALAAGSLLPGLAAAACGGATPRQTEGPYFRPGTPQRADLREGLPGRPFDLEGRLLGRDCRPLAGAVVELWHADSDGRYDNDGYRCRGHLPTDAEGRFRFRTVVPGLYPGRTRHFHLTLAAEGAGGGRPLTTQLYFPDEPGNARDWIYDPALLMRLEPLEGGRTDGTLVGRFDFLLG